MTMISDIEIVMTYTCDAGLHSDESSWQRTALPDSQGLSFDACMEDHVHLTKTSMCVCCAIAQTLHSWQRGFLNAWQRGFLSEPSILTARQPATASPANLTLSSVHLVVLFLILPIYDTRMPCIAALHTCHASYFTGQSMTPCRTKSQCFCSSQMRQQKVAWCPELNFCRRYADRSSPAYVGYELLKSPFKAPDCKVQAQDSNAHYSPILMTLT